MHFVSLDSTCRKRALKTLSTKNLSLCSRLCEPLLLSVIHVPTPSYCHYPGKGGHNYYRTRYVSTTRTTFTHRKSRYTTLLIRPLLRNSTNVQVCPPTCLTGLHSLYSTCGIRLVTSRVTANFNHAKDVFTYSRTNISPSVVYISGKLANNCVPVSVAVAARGVCSTFCTSCERKGTFVRDRACSNGPLKYSTTLTILGILSRRRVVPQTRRGTPLFQQVVVRALKSRPRIKRVHDLKLIGTVRLIRGERAGGDFPSRRQVKCQVCERTLGQKLLLHPLNSILCFGPPLIVSPRRVRRTMSVYTSYVHGILKWVFVQRGGAGYSFLGGVIGRRCDTVVV